MECRTSAAPAWADETRRILRWRCKLCGISVFYKLSPGCWQNWRRLRWWSHRCRFSPSLLILVVAEDYRKVLSECIGVVERSKDMVCRFEVRIFCEKWIQAAFKVWGLLFHGKMAKFRFDGFLLIEEWSPWGQIFFFFWLEDCRKIYWNRFWGWKSANMFELNRKTAFLFLHFRNCFFTVEKCFFSRICGAGSWKQPKRKIVWLRFRANENSFLNKS